MSHHIAIVEDERTLAANYRDALQRQGFRVSLYDNRVAANKAFEHQLPDLAIIDVGLGSEVEGGFELCRDLRSRCPELPIVFLTARDSELDIISGLRLGADEYLTKDISHHLLQTRIITLLARVQALRSPEQREHVIERNQLRMNDERKTASWRDEPLGLTVGEFSMVHLLAKRPGQLKSRQELMDAAETVVDENTVTSHIKRIRRKFEAIDPAFDAIETVYGRGYIWKMPDK